jgi:hypothetical protein
VNFKNASIDIPAKWSAKEKGDCLLIRPKLQDAANYLEVCKNQSSDESYYFTMNDDGEWEAVTEGIPILADMNVTPKYKGMSATVSCKYKDNAGYHTEQCFQAEIDLPSHINFIFTGRGDSYLFNEYKKSYLSFKTK